jgi:hypothetical protein
LTARVRTCIVASGSHHPLLAGRERNVRGYVQSDTQIAKAVERIIQRDGIRRASASLDTHHSVLTKLAAGLPVRRSNLSHIRLKLEALAKAERER